MKNVEKENLDFTSTNVAGVRLWELNQKRSLEVHKILHNCRNILRRFVALNPLQELSY
jgi:hypothetical protein